MSARRTERMRLNTSKILQILVARVDVSEFGLFCLFLRLCVRGESLLVGFTEDLQVAAVRRVFRQGRFPPVEPEVFAPCVVLPVWFIDWQRGVRAMGHLVPPNVGAALAVEMFNVKREQAQLDFAFAKLLKQVLFWVDPIELHCKCLGTIIIIITYECLRQNGRGWCAERRVPRRVRQSAVQVRSSVGRADTALQVRHPWL